MITPEQAEIVKDIVPIDKLYEDALRPSLKQIGGVLESVTKVARFLFAPIEYAAAYQDRWQRQLKKVADNVKEDNLIEGQPQMVVPIINGLCLSLEGSLLSELFINLLAKSIDKTQQSLAHPSFPNLIGQLSHDEAVIIYYLKKGTLVAFTTPEDKIIEHGIGVKVNYVRSHQVLQFSAHLSMYREHLISLNICVDHGNGGFWLSSFGRLFAEACVPDEFHLSQTS